LGKTAVLLVAVLFVCVLTLVTLGPMQSVKKNGRGLDNR